MDWTSMIRAGSDAAKRWGWGAFAAAIGVASLAWMRDFTVDDALISVRYAHNIRAGVGHTFNAGGPATDGVTPLAWPYLLALVGGSDALATLARATALGIVAWLIVWVGFARLALGSEFDAAIGAASRRGVVLVGFSSVLGAAAYAASGMETMLAALLVAGGVFGRRATRGRALLLGLGATIRPELLPFVAVATASRHVLERTGVRRLGWGLLGAVGPFVMVAALRAVAFGRPAPLAVLAKPSDLPHGLVYLAASTLATGLVLMVLAPRELFRTGARTKALALGLLAHALGIAAAGGDWMPYSRLWVPVLPAVGVVALDLASRGSVRGFWIRAFLGLGFSAWVWTQAAPLARGVRGDRERLILRARTRFGSNARIACVDIGWVGAATHGEIVDLAGVTDPVVAARPGGHTSKRLDAAWLIDREPDWLLVLVRGMTPELARQGPSAWPIARVVEARLARDPLIIERYAPRAYLPLGAGGQGYVALERANRKGDTKRDAPKR